MTQGFARLRSSGIVVFVPVLAMMFTTGCLSVWAGTSRNVPLSDFFGLQPTVQIEWPKMTLIVPTNYPSSSAYISPKAKTEGNNVLIEAEYVLVTKPATTTFNLRKLGMKPDKVSTAKVFWVNPDGTKKELPIIRDRQ